MAKRRSFSRPPGKRRYRKLFVIATEGTITEPIYFSLFNDQNAVVRVSCVKGKKSDYPLTTLKRLKKKIAEEALRKNDEAWLVIDKDDWTEQQLQSLFDWSKEQENYGFALSNPKVEYWLLLHFEDGSKSTTPTGCAQRLQKYLPGYDKGFDPRKISREMVDDAIARAKQRDMPPCTDWPREEGITTVYRLVENIIKGA